MSHISIHVFTVILFQNSNKVVSSIAVSSLNRHFCYIYSRYTSNLLYYAKINKILILTSNYIAVTFRNIFNAYVLENELLNMNCFYLFSPLKIKVQSARLIQVCKWQTHS